MLLSTTAIRSSNERFVSVCIQAVFMPVRDAHISV
jgi:hypothetical protein